MKEIILKGLDDKVLQAKCANGLSVYMHVNPKVNNFFITYNCRYGSIHTEFKIKGEKKYRQVPNGVAHFLEHVNFNESNGQTAQEYFHKLGSSINAFTSPTSTSYEVVSSTFFKENLEHLLDYVSTPYFTKKNVAKEKNIIIEEIKMGKNQTGSLLYFGSCKGLFHYDKHRNLTTGEIKDVRKITATDLKFIHEVFYHPKNMFVIITGNFDPQEAMKIISKNQKQKPIREYLYPQIKKIKEPLTPVKKYQTIKANVEIPKVKIILKLARQSFAKYDDVELDIILGTILRNNFGTCSDLKEKLQEEEKVTSMTYLQTVYTSSPIVTLSVIAETRYPQEIIKIIKNQFHNLQVDEAMITRRRRANIASLVYALDNIENVNFDLQSDLIAHHKIIDNYFDIYSGIEITKVQEVMNQIKPDNYSVTVLVPNKKTIS